MKLKEYMKNLNALVKARPDAKDMEVVTSSDDEGNSFHPVVYAPTIGYYEGREFDDRGSDENAVCVN